MNIGFVDRPLVAGLIFGAAAGNIPLSLSVALVFELFWLDLFPAGTFIPPHAAASTLASLSLVAWFGLEDPGRIAPLMALCLPLAFMGAKLEHVHRRWQNSCFNMLLHAFREDGEARLDLRAIVRRSLAQSAIMNGLFMFASVTLLIILARPLVPLLPPPRDHGLSWSHLWLLASLGGVLALRVRRAYAALILAVSLAIVGNLALLIP